MSRGTWRGPTAIFLVLLFFIGCGDDPAAPSGQSVLEELSGDWEVVAVVADSLVHEIPDNNIFWYFSNSGEFCTLWRTAYGSYYPGNSGQVSPDGRVLTEEMGHVQARWRLFLSTAADSLEASLIEPDTLDVDRWFLVRTAEAPEATCFGDKRQ